MASTPEGTVQVSLAVCTQQTHASPPDCIPRFAETPDRPARVVRVARVEQTEDQRKSWTDLSEVEPLGHLGREGLGLLGLLGLLGDEIGEQKGGRAMRNAMGVTRAVRASRVTPSRLGSHG